MYIGFTLNFRLNIFANFKRSMRGYGDPNEGCYNITRQVIPGDLEPSPTTSSIIVHYQIQVDVLDYQYNLVASRTKDKSIQITFSGLTQGSDIEEIADSLIGQSELLPESNRPLLLRALNDLRMSIGKPITAMPRNGSSNQIKSQSQEPQKKASEAAPQLALKLSKAEVDNLLHDSLNKIFFGNETECIKTLSNLVEISKYDRNLSLIIQHEPLMNTLINSLKKFNTSSLPACICIIQILERMSAFSNYQEILTKFRIGSMSLSLLHAQVVLSNVANKNLDKDKLQSYISTQNSLLKHVVGLLFNLAENPTAMRKMVNKDIVTPLCLLLTRQSVELVTLTLRFLRRIANISTNWGDVPYEDIVKSLIQNIFVPKKQPNPAVLRESLELLFTFSFHKECITEFKNQELLPALARFSSVNEIRSPLIKFFYNCTSAENSDALFRDPAILNALISATTANCEERMISLVILMKLSCDKECAQTIAQSSVFTTSNLKNMFAQATSKQTQENKILLKMIRNVADNQPSLIDGFDEEIVKGCLNNARNMDILADIFAVSSRAKMNNNRAKFFTSRNDFVNLIIQILSNQSAKSQLHLEIVMFVSSVSLFKEPAKTLQEAKVVDKVINIFKWHSEDIDIQIQCMFAFYRFIIHSDSRSDLLKHDEIIDMIIKHSASRNAVLNSIANTVLEALEIFDKKTAAKIKFPRFVAFNEEWLQVFPLSKRK
ncbi:hypothetical protein TRFO_07762 [Tritrichomonas foetus]|uniref:Uncharacterized protein n=1 Tax=Tritrichomonas foetus TaxID=1144522 RepID=A0A1J4JNR0_9EUKA|nr:hypothetical protein TRFO_07762 [Tritrichomonas foetus]|eukprot:OHT00783.1 hypothetical protein TRFO_07762 [Tritrichomonas foetus]